MCDIEAQTASPSRKVVLLTTARRSLVKRLQSPGGTAHENLLSKEVPPAVDAASWQAPPVSPAAPHDAEEEGAPAELHRRHRGAQWQFYQQVQAEAAAAARALRAPAPALEASETFPFSALAGLDHMGDILTRDPVPREATRRLNPGGDAGGPPPLKTAAGGADTGGPAKPQPQKQMPPQRFARTSAEALVPIEAHAPAPPSQVFGGTRRRSGR